MFYMLVLDCRFKQLYQLSAANVLHTEYYVRGVIFAVAAAPEIPLPQVWLPWAFQHHGQLAHHASTDELADGLMDCLKAQLQQQTDVQATWLPKECVYDETQTSPLANWLLGLLTAHQQMQVVWQRAWRQVQEHNVGSMQSVKKDLRHCLSMFSTFANIPLAIEQAVSDGKPELQQQLPHIFLSLPKALGMYVDVSGKLVDFLPDQFEQYRS